MTIPAAFLRARRRVGERQQVYDMLQRKLYISWALSKDPNELSEFIICPALDAIVVEMWARG